MGGKQLRGSNGKRALASVAIAALLAAGCVSAARADDAPPPAATTPSPSPDPAPPLPKPKPAPPPKPAATPARVYHAPVQPSAPAPAPSAPAPARPAYTPPVVHHVAKKVKVVRHTRAHARRHKARRAVVVPKVHAQVKHATVVHIAGVPAASIATNGSEVARSPLVIAGIVLAALLFLLVVTVPSTGARHTSPGRVVMDHQTQLVLAGAALLLVTAVLFALAGNG